MTTVKTRHADHVMTGLEKRLEKALSRGMAGWYRHLMVSVFVGWFLLTAVSLTFAGIPEPGIIMYGKVFDVSGQLVTSGELSWSFTPVSGGESVTVVSPLEEIDAQGGPFSYRALISLETAVPGYPVSEGAIPILSAAVAYTRTGQVVGTGISMTDTVAISADDRGTCAVVSIGTAADSDNDGIDDSWEQGVVDDDPSDAIASINDINPGDDLDGDGEDNQTEWANGTDPLDATSTSENGTPYANFHFEIYRGSEQLSGSVFDTYFWGAVLNCRSRDGETLLSGALGKPPGTAGSSLVALEILDDGREARSWDEFYSSLSQLMGDYTAGQYRVNMIANNGGLDYPLRFKIEVPGYDATSFPNYVAVEYPLPDENEVPLEPVLDFNTADWDSLLILNADTSEEYYVHLHDAADDPPDQHAIAGEHALEPNTSYALWVDSNDWDGSWLGSKMNLFFTTAGIDCYGDFDEDGDVDGRDLFLFETGIHDLSLFAQDFGKVGCTIP